MSSIEGRYVRNEAKDGWSPACSKCGHVFEDAEVGEVKNYPEDGLIAVWFNCPNDKEEVSFNYVPYQPKALKK